jgi:hypothetical protein
VNDAEDDPTPRPTGLRRASEESTAVANIGLALAAIAVRIRQAARDLDKLEGDKRRRLFLELAHEIAEHGDDCHVVRRLIEEIYR